MQRHHLAEFIGVDLARYRGETETDVVGRTAKQEPGARRDFRSRSRGMRTGASTGRRPYWRITNAPVGKLSGLIEPPWSLGAYQAAICATAILDRDDLMSGDPPVVRIHVSERLLDLHEV